MCSVYQRAFQLDHLLRWNEAARYELSEGETGSSNPSMTDTMQSRPATVAMVFAGGLGLGAYHAGAYQAFSRRSSPLHWVAGSSAGAVTAALIAGNRSDDRIERLRAFWNFPSPVNFSGELWSYAVAASAWMDRRYSHQARWQPGTFQSPAPIDEPVRFSQPLRPDADEGAHGGLDRFRQA